jgi:DNA-binding CsgD family transcriptional regulator
MSQRAGMSATEFAAWNEAWRSVTTATSAAAIADALVAALRILLDFDTAFLTLLRRDSAPVVPHYMAEEAEPSPAYHEGPYLLDPFYNHFLAGGGEGCFRLAELAPEGFLRSRYFSSYYRHLEIRDELGLLAAIDPGASAHVSILRHRNPARFSRRDAEWLSACAPLAREALRRMAEFGGAPGAAPAGGAGTALHDSLRAAYRNFGASVLTEREREVVHLLLQGNSAKAIARALAISPDTARNHLKRIYPKLDVSSQAELFALFFRALEQVEPGFDGDPLTRLARPR